MPDSSYWTWNASLEICCACAETAVKVARKTTDPAIVKYLTAAAAENVESFRFFRKYRKHLCALGALGGEAF
jgi:hypothetical protein